MAAPGSTNLPSQWYEFTKAVSLRAAKSTDTLPSLSSVTFHSVWYCWPFLPSHLPSLLPYQPSLLLRTLLPQLSSSFNSLTATSPASQLTSLDYRSLTLRFSRALSPLSVCCQGHLSTPTFSYHQVENAPKFPTFLLILKSVIYFYIKHLHSEIPQYSNSCAKHSMSIFHVPSTEPGVTTREMTRLLSLQNLQNSKTDIVLINNFRDVEYCREVMDVIQCMRAHAQDKQQLSRQILVDEGGVESREKTITEGKKPSIFN